MSSASRIPEQQTKLAPAPRSQNPTHFMVPAPAFALIVSMLKQRPWEEVHALMGVLDQCHGVVAEQEPVVNGK